MHVPKLFGLIFPVPKKYRAMVYVYSKEVLEALKVVQAGGIHEVVVS